MKFIAEIGINHNGNLANALKMVDIAKAAGADIVKFQKRNPEKCVPGKMKNVMKYNTPWGDITYLKYKELIEFGKKEYDIIDNHCRAIDIEWSASAWDEDSFEFLMNYDLPCHKIPSAMLRNLKLLEMVSNTGEHTYISTGMSSLDEIDEAVKIFKKKKCPFELMHCNSTYPLPPEEVNLRCIPMLRERYQCDVGYSGHEVGLQVSLAAVVFGITSLERHVTLDRSMWGSDQAASLEKRGFELLIRDVKIIQSSLGDGQKRIYPGEMKKREQLSYG